MKKLFLTVALIGISYFSKAQVWVDSYTKSNGTVVQGHYRSEPNNTKLDNWSTYPNVNPYTGETGTIKLDYYDTPFSIEYYTPVFNSLYLPDYTLPVYIEPSYSLPQSSGFDYRTAKLKF
jgi:hypothetical protein